MVDEFPISLEKAKEQRLELMEERKNLYDPFLLHLDMSLIANYCHSVIDQTERMEDHTFNVSPPHIYSNDT